MTLSAAARVNEYLGNGSTVTFPVQFQFFGDDEIEVALRDARGNEITQSLGAGFSVDGGDGGTGSVTFDAAPSAAYVVVVRGATSVAQQDAYPDGGDFPSPTVERGFDRSAARHQENRDAIDDTAARALTLPPGYTQPNLPPPSAMAGGNRIIAPDPITGVPTVLDGSAFQGAPGGNVSDVGPFIAAKVLDIVGAQPGTTTIRLSDRGKAVFEIADPALAIPAAYPNDENFWWFRDGGGTVWVLAGQVISVEATGASVLAVDNTAAINAALRFGKAFARGVQLPVGNWHKSGITFADSVSFTGEGYYSNLVATEYENGAIWVQGVGPQLANMRRSYTGDTTRGGGDDRTGNGVYVDGADKFTVEDVWIERGSRAGLLCRGGTNGRINHVDVSDTAADGIHLTGNSRNNRVSYSAVHRSGDDCFANVSYLADGVLAGANTFDHCFADAGAARGFAIIGGEDIEVTSFRAINCAACGVIIGSDGSGGGTAGVRNVKIDTGTVDQCGSAARGYAAVQVIARPGYDTVDVTINNATVTNSRKQSVSLVASDGFIRDATVRGCRLAYNAENGIYSDGVVDLTIDNNRLVGVGGYGIAVARGAGRLTITRNLGEDINNAGQPGADWINIASGQPYGTIILGENEVRLPASGTQNFERNIECFYDNVVAYDNRGPGEVRLGNLGAGAVDRQNVRGSAVADPAAPATLDDAAAKADLLALVSALRNAGVIAIH